MFVCVCVREYLCATCMWVTKHGFVHVRPVVAFKAFTPGLAIQRLAQLHQLLNMCTT